MEMECVVATGLNTSISNVKWILSRGKKKCNIIPVTPAGRYIMTWLHDVMSVWSGGAIINIIISILFISMGAIIDGGVQGL